MPTLVDRAKMFTATTGTGTLTLGAAVPNFQTFATAGVTNGQTIRYVLEDTGFAWEIGIGTYSSTGPTLTRGATESSTGGGAISLTGNASVYVSATAADFIAGQSLNQGRNLIHNGRFNVQQRGTGSWTTGVYTADRWLLNLIGDTCTVSIATLADADRTTIGDENATSALQAVVTGASTAANYTQIQQRIENVRMLSGKTVTVSFYAKASAALNVGILFSQVFGTGGSTSVNGTAQTIGLTTSWVRYSATFVIASASGKTFGTANTDYTQMTVSLSSGTTNAALLGVSTQSGTFTFFGVQLEIGTAATTLEVRPYGPELALCQRFFQVAQPTEVINTACAYTTSCYFSASFFFKVPFRATPTASTPTWTLSTCGTPTIAENGLDMVNYYALSTAASNVVQFYNSSQILFSADL